MKYDDIKFWISELDSAKKRQKSYIKEGRRIVNIYQAEGNDKAVFNILYSNTDVLLPALYSATPSPVVKRRFSVDENPLARAAAKASERMLSYLLDTNLNGYESFDESIRNIVLDGLLPGRGCSNVKYDADIQDTGEYEEKAAEHICNESIPWDSVLFGYSKKWADCPWVAIIKVINKEEAIRLFGADEAAKLSYEDDRDDNDRDRDDSSQDLGDQEKKLNGTTTIYQIWDKDGGNKVRYISNQKTDGFLRVDDDPLGLSGFFPVPRPFLPIAKSNDLCPTPLYSLYEDQAEELNRISRSIKSITKAIKVKGLYDAELETDLSQLFEGDDLSIIPANKSSTLSAEKGFDNIIWFMPVDMLIRVLRELYVARNECKQTIYEINGIADIIRGATAANETATAQSIKSQWGTMRLKRYQAEVQRYCRDTLRLMLEVAVNNFSVQTWAQVTGLNYATSEQVFQAQQILQNIPPNNQNPKIQEALQNAQQMLNAPRWDDILKILRDDMQRSFQIDIETNSTVIPEATEDKQNINEALMAIGAYLKDSLPVVERGYLSFGIFKNILLKISRQYSFGEEIENELNSLQPPPPPAPPALAPDHTMELEQMRQQQEMQKMQHALQVSAGDSKIKLDIEQMRQQQENAMEQNRAQTQIQIEQMRLEHDKEIEVMKAQAEFNIEQMKMAAMAKIEQVRAELQQTPEAPPNEGAEIGAAMQQHTELLAALVNELTQPKTIIKDESGWTIN